MKPFYRFSLNLNTGEVKRVTIDDYEFRWGVREGESYYKFKLGSTYYYAYLDQFDRLTNNRIYSWSDDMENAKQLIAKSLLSRIERLKNESAKYMHALDNLRSRDCSK